MIRVNLLEDKAKKQEFSVLQKTEILLTAAVAAALILMIFLPQ